MADAASTILLRAGVLGPQSLAAATALKQREGGTLGEALVRLGLVDEERLVAVFQEGLLVPAVGPKELLQVDKAVLQAVPARMAAEFRVIPIDIDGEGNLALAMADPTDNRAVDAVAAHTGRFVMRAVAAPTAVRQALLSLYGVSLGGKAPGAEGATTPSTPPAARPQGAIPSKRNTLPGAAKVVPEVAIPAQRPPEAVLMALARAVDSGSPPSGATLPGGSVSIGSGGGAPAPEAAQKPPQKRRHSQKLPAPDLDAKAPKTSRTPRRSTKMAAISPVKPEEPILLDKPVSEPSTGTTIPGLGGTPTQELLAPVARLRAAADRDEVVSVLLDFAGHLAARVGLFVVQKGQLACLDGRGPDHVVVAMKWFTIPVDTPSPFRDVLESRAPYIGSLSDTAESRAFRSALGSTEGDLLLLPLLVGNRAVGVLYADEIKEDLGRLSRELETLSREAGAAFARIILSAKKK